MISVCSTIHGSPKACSAFIHSIYENATGEDFEVVLISDRNSPEEENMLWRLAASFSRLSLLFSPRSYQIRRNKDMLPFWAEVYGMEIAEYASRQLDRYKAGEIDLWLQYAHGLNLAAQLATGDFLLLTPADFVVMCDLHELNQALERKVAEASGRFFGHFSLVAPFDRTPTSLRDVVLGTELFSHEYDFVRVYLDSRHSKTSEYPITPGIDRYWPFNHGVRIVDQVTFQDVGGLMDKFLSKPGPTDIFNRMARFTAYGKEEARRKRSIEELTGFRARMASVPFDDPEPIEYLYPNPCDGDAVRKMQYAEEKWVREHEPTFAEVI